MPAFERFPLAGENATTCRALAHTNTPACSRYLPHRLRHSFPRESARESKGALLPDRLGVSSFFFFVAELLLSHVFDVSLASCVEFLRGREITQERTPRESELFCNRYLVLFGSQRMGFFSVFGLLSEFCCQFCLSLWGNESGIGATEELGNRVVIRERARAAGFQGRFLMGAGFVGWFLWLHQDT